MNDTSHTAPPLVPSSDSSFPTGGEQFGSSLAAIENRQEPPAGLFDPVNAVIFVRQYIEFRGYELRFDNVLLNKRAPLRAESPAEIERYLSVDTLDERGISDEIYLFAISNNFEHKKSALDAALRTVFKQLRKRRFKTVISPLIGKGFTAQAQAEAEWARVSTLFDMPRHLSIAVLGHFIWQVKQKCLGRPVGHHLMPIIFSIVQGSGKTTFVRSFVAPLRELASANALISDFADRRSGEIYAFPVVLIDDMETVARSDVAKLKNVVTADRLNRRRLGTSRSSSMRQLATLIGTSNVPIARLIDDDTGHRRFASMPFRNGNVSKGGDEQVWATVSGINYQLLWESIDAFGPSPIKAHLSELYSFQDTDRPTPRVLAWLRTLDLKSAELQAITTRHGVRSEKLRELMVRDTQEELSRNKFADEMLLYFRDDTTPFSGKCERDGLNFYVPRLSV